MNNETEKALTELMIFAEKRGGRRDIENAFTIRAALEGTAAGPWKDPQKEPPEKGREYLIQFQRGIPRIGAWVEVKRDRCSIRNEWRSEGIFYKYSVVKFYAELNPPKEQK